MSVTLTDTKIKWGFDCTSFKPNGFQQVLKQLGIPEGNLIEEMRKDLDGNLYRRSFIWSDNRIKIITCNNPITGEYNNQSVQREIEKDYASYIGLEGEPVQVEMAVKLIKKYSDFIKDESPLKRDFI